MKQDRRESGFVLVTTALGIIVLLGFLGLAVDVGFLQYQKRRIQSAADAAAIGAALQLSKNATNTTAKAEGKYDSAKNGFTDGSNGVTVTINIPPLSGNYTSSSSAVEAIVQQNNATYFMQLFNINLVGVAARSVAMPGNSPNCIYVLDPSASDAFLASGGSTTVNASCGINVNSTNAKGLEGTGGACIDATTVNLVASSDSGAQLPTCAGFPSPNLGQKAVADPLSYLTAPIIPASCDYTNYTAANGSTLNPGNYCGGITVSGGATVHLNKGLYILNGGGLQVSGGSSLISNVGGVTFDNTYSAGYSYKAIAISGGSSTNLQAPTTASGGDLPGILFFDRSGAYGDQETISGASGANFTGAMYFLNSQVVYSGGSSGSGQWSIIVADRVNFSGGSSIGKDFSGYTSGSPIKSGGLFVE